VRGIYYKAVRLNFTGFAGLHSNCQLDLKGQNVYKETYRRRIFGKIFARKYVGLS